MQLHRVLWLIEKHQALIHPAEAAKGLNPP